MVRFIKSPPLAALPEDVPRLEPLGTAFEFRCRTVLQNDPKTGRSLDKPYDFRDVIIEGYASTFGSPQMRDTQGDYFLPGCWENTSFAQLPAMLINHDWSKIAGSWTKVYTTSAGLVVRGKISNAPHLRELRLQLMSGQLRGL